MERDFIVNITEQMTQLLDEFETLVPLSPPALVVVGTSTSEVIGKAIGTAGAFAIAEALYRPLRDYELRTGAAIAFQCCEHLNRALVIDKAVAETFAFTPVTVRPVRQAGGAMAAYAYEQMNAPVVVEAIQADAGIDIGNTLIGMHLKRVAVPVRTSIRTIGHANITAAKTRPKLIGGERAVYPKQG